MPGVKLLGRANLQILIKHMESLMETKKLPRLKILSLIGIGALALAGFRQMMN